MQEPFFQLLASDRDPVRALLSTLLGSFDLVHPEIKARGHSHGEERGGGRKNGGRGKGKEGLKEMEKEIGERRRKQEEEGEGGERERGGKNGKRGRRRRKNTPNGSHYATVLLAVRLAAPVCF